jgi:hypothetical protein
VKNKDAIKEVTLLKNNIPLYTITEHTKINIKELDEHIEKIIKTLS